MTVTQSARSLGSFGVTLTDTTPDEVWNSLGYFGHVAIYDGRVDPVAIGDAGLRSARYVGVLRQKGKPVDRRTLGGSGMIFWLGDEDNKGKVIENKLTFTNATLAAVVAAVLPPAVTLGTIFPLPDPAARYSGVHQWQSPRQVLDIVCDAFGIEYRVNGDATVDFGTQAQLYRTLPGANPSPLVVRREPGTDVDVVAVGASYETDTTTLDYSTRVVLLGQSTDAGQFATGSINAPVVPYVDMHGNPVVFTRLISESDQTTGSVAARTQLQLNRYNRVSRSLNVSPEGYELVGAFRPGDDTYVYDPDSEITNAAHEVVYHGEVIHPDIVRVAEMTWPVADGMTVAFRTSAGVWVDLTPFVTYETGASQMIVGDLPYSLSKPGDDAFTIRTDLATGQVPDATVPGVPTGLTLSTDGYLDQHGNNVAIIGASWAEPLNTNGTAITDLAYYVVRFRVVGRPQWQYTYTDATTAELPAVIDIDYEVEVAAVDTSGHSAGYTAAQTIHTSVDTTPPNAPADPTVGSYLGQLKITYLGTDNGGNPMPADAARIDVEVATTSAGPYTVVSQLDPRAPGIAYADAPYGSTRYVRLRAYDRTGNPSAASGIVSGATVQVADGDIASLNVGKLLAGQINVDIIVATRLTTALIGARTELNAVGVQAWNAAGVKTIDLNGASNLLLGTLQTDVAPNRRMLIGPLNGNNGRISFFAPDGTETRLDSFTAGTGVEAIRLQIPDSGVAQGWNAISIDNGHHIFAVSGIVQVYFGGGVTSQAFQVGYIPTKGDATHAIPPAGSVQRMTITPNDFRINWNSSGTQVTAMLFVGSSGDVIQYDGDGNDRIRVEAAPSNKTWLKFGATAPVGYMQIIPGGFSGTSSSGVVWAPAITMATAQAGGTGVSYGGQLQYAVNVDGTTNGINVVDFSGSPYIPIKAQSFVVSSDANGKTDITDAELSALDLLAATPVRQYRLTDSTATPLDTVTIDDEDKTVLRPAKRRKAKPGPFRIGLIAQESPEQIRNVDAYGGLGVDLYAYITMCHKAIMELQAKLDGKGKP